MRLLEQLTIGFNTTPSIGLAAAGNGNIASFSALNTTPNPVAATITITPTANGCIGPDSTFSITVNPRPLVNSITDQVLCSNAATNAIVYSSATAGTTFAWTNNAPSIGLAANGNGNIASFTGVNTTPIPVIATITVAATEQNGCVGPDSTFTITVNPIPSVNTISNQTLCANAPTNAINFTSATPGTTYDWVNTTPSIGLAAAGNGNIASFSALNTTPNPVVATITVTPTANGCIGPDSTFTITINPTPITNSISDQVLCANMTTNAVVFTSATSGVVFNWTNSVPSVGLAVNGNGNIAPFTALNPTAIPVISTITITPTANGCNGPDSIFTITVNPIPSTNSIPDQELWCTNVNQCYYLYKCYTWNSIFLDK